MKAWAPASTLSPTWAGGQELTRPLSATTDTAGALTISKSSSREAVFEMERGQGYPPLGTGHFPPEGITLSSTIETRLP